MLALLAGVHDEQRRVLLGGGEKYIARHHERGKLTVRESVNHLVDPSGWFLELSPLAGLGTRDPIGGGMVTGIGVISDVECVVIANDPTVRGGSLSPTSVKKQELVSHPIAASEKL